MKIRQEQMDTLAAGRGGAVQTCEETASEGKVKHTTPKKADELIREHLETCAKPGIAAGKKIEAPRSRSLNLLQNAGIVVQQRPLAKGAELAHAKRAWTYVTSDGRVGIWIYEFDGQNELDKGVAEIEKRLAPQKRAWDFAQNGEYLMLIVPNAPAGEAGDRQTMNRILQAFSGEVER